MSKPRSRIVDFAVYLAVRVFVCIIQGLSLEAGCTLANIIAWLAYRIDRRHREVAMDNLCHALGDRTTAAERDAIVRSVYKHFCQVIIEISHLPRRMHPQNWRRYTAVVGGRRLVDCLLSDRPILLLTGHYGNWEMAGYVLGLLGFPIHSVARPLDNPYLEDYLRRFRERTGQKLLAKKGDFEKMQDILVQGGLLGTLADQDAGKRGIFVNFFNRPASTHKANAFLSLQYNVPILVSVARNAGRPFQYEMIAEELILPEDYEKHPDPVTAITQRFTSTLERLIREVPEQYFWLHRRWKHQPRRSKRRAA
jgi:KDO2-lipid IV(A) lauroyltransferase